MTEIYDLLDQKIRECDKPLFPILPSISSSYKELVISSTRDVNFPDEVVLGKALANVANTLIRPVRKYSLKY